MSVPIVAAIVFFIAGAGTPGPNNTIVMAAGATYGWRRTVPAIVGINIGFPTMIVVLGVGLGSVLVQWPWVLDVLRPIGVVYLLWLAWKIANGPTNLSETRAASPPGLWHMAGFQFVNPKAWTLAVAALSAFAGASAAGHFLVDVLVLAAIALVFSTPCTVVWTLLGVAAGRFLRTPRALRVFNLIMAGLLVVSLIPAVQQIIGTVRQLLG